MRALPGRVSRAPISTPASVTQGTVGEDQRRRVLRATGELVAKRGYNDVSVELIAKRAEISLTTFYKHFRGKEEAYVELFDTMMGEAGRRVADILASEADSPWPQQVACALQALFEVILSDPIIAKACIVEAPSVGPAMRERNKQGMRALIPLLRRGRDLEPRRPPLPETLEETLAGGVLWSAYQRLISGEVDRIEQLYPEAVQFVLRPYIGAAEARRWAESLAGSMNVARSPAR